MGWDEVDNKLKRGVDAGFVACTEKYEIDYIKKVVKEEVGDHSESEIEKAIKDCCESIKAPRPRKDFIECLKRKFG
jgi:hypothetical protein